MAFDFPANPSIGQPFVVSGIAYVFDGVAWNVAATPQAVLTADSRNRVRNPNFIISQENGDNAGITTGYYMADQWFHSWSSAVGQAAAGRVAATPPSGSRYALHTYVNTVDTALVTEWLGVTQRIEGLDIADFRWGSADAKPAVLRFWAYSQLGGTYGGCVRSSAPAARSFVFGFTLPAATWTEVVRAIPGDTSATAWNSDSTLAAELWFTWAASSTQCAAPGWNNGGNIGATGQDNGFASTANHFYVADVGLYKDPLGTGLAPPWEAPDFADELRRCQRYWKRMYSILLNPNVNNGSTFFNVMMRTNPSITNPTASPGFGVGASTSENADIYGTRAYTDVILNARI